MIVCPTCKTQNPDDGGLCSNCGTKLAELAQQVALASETVTRSGLTAAELREQLQAAAAAKVLLAADFDRAQKQLLEAQTQASQLAESLQQLTQQHTALGQEHQTLLGGFEERLRKVRSYSVILASVATILGGAGGWLIKGSPRDVAVHESASDKVNGTVKQPAVKPNDTTNVPIDAEAATTRLAVGKGCLQRKHYGCAKAVADDVLKQFPGNTEAAVLKLDIEKAEKAERGAPAKDQKIIIR